VKRREFIELVGGAAAAWPITARARRPAMPVVGYLGAETPERSGIRLSAFRQSLSEMGFEEGRNVKYRWAEGQNERLPALAADLVDRKVAVIAVPGSGFAALVARAATHTIPIVFEIGLDPVTAGLVSSLSRPAGNLTDITSLNLDVFPKGLELLRELIPQAKNFAALVNPTNRVTPGIIRKGLEGPSRALGIQIQFLNASGESELEPLFAKLAQMGVAGLILGGDPFFNTHGPQLAALTLKYSVPAVHTVREFAVSGGLMSYGGNIKDTHRQAGIYTGRVLKGEKPADLPIQQASKVELCINLKTAKALGVTVPLPLSGRADEVIE
jgi:putative ABC transport system substrate-binding protein